MLDLNHLMLKSSASIESDLVDPQKTELLISSSDDEDRVIDPAPFMLFLTQILENTLIEKEGNSMDKDETLSIGEQTITLGEGSQGIESTDIKTLTQVVDMEHLNQVTSFELDNSSVNEMNQSLNNLQNNVALAWIDSKDFQPPQSIAKELEDVKVCDPELIMQLSDKEQLMKSLSTKNNLNSADLKINYNEMLNASEADKNIMTEQINNKFAMDSEENLSIYFERIATWVSSSEMIGVESLQKSGIESSGLDTIQNIVQSNLFINDKNQIKALGPDIAFLDIPVAINNTQWEDKFSEHIVWLGNQGIKSALIKINPDELGPLEISIKVIKDTASVNINTHSSYVRDIVDQAIPRLREMMAEQGLNLSDVHIGADTNSRQFSQNSETGGENGVNNSEEIVEVTQISKKIPQGLIDYFA